MDHRVKPGGDEVGSVWSILHAEFESPDCSPRSTNGSKYMPFYVAEFQCRYNNRFHAAIFGAAFPDC
jgi:hypothetical protein